MEQFNVVINESRKLLNANLNSKLFYNLTIQLLMHLLKPLILFANANNAQFIDKTTQVDGALVATMLSQEYPDAEEDAKEITQKCNDMFKDESDK